MDCGFFIQFYSFRNTIEETELNRFISPIRYYYEYYTSDIFIHIYILYVLLHLRISYKCINIRSLVIAL